LEFSRVNRSAIREKLSAEQFDVLVIGGGITGAGIALDAVSRGLKTALIEQGDFASGTSSKSTKLVHGGLRYLKQLEFGLVKEVGSERAIVHRLAPHLVVPEKMLLPLYERRGLGYWLTSIGLRIYDFLAGVKSEDQRRMLTRAQTLSAEPLLHTEGVKGGALYAEYRTDDARLTIEIIKTAVSKGATVLNYIKGERFVYRDGRIAGIVATDGTGGLSLEIKSTVVINAGGPWVDLIRAIEKPVTGKRLHHTKGIHIVVPHERFPVRQAIYFDVEDGRMIFAIPRGRTTYIGTTDTNYNGDLNNVVATRDDVDYILHAVNQTFPATALKLEDVESSWAGLRPLIHEEGKTASQLSRKDEIFESEAGLISIAGGKLTGYRKMAERVINLVVKRHFPTASGNTGTGSIALTKASFQNRRDVAEYENRVRARLTNLGLPDMISRYLVENYGQGTDEVLDTFEREPQDTHPDFRLISSEFKFCFSNEMVVHVDDFLERRTGLLYFHIGRARHFAHPLIDLLKNLDPSVDGALEAQRVEQAISSCINFK